MCEEKKALPTEGPVKCTQKRELAGESMGRYRMFLGLTLAFCLLLVDGFLWHGPCAGLTATVFAWYALVLAWMGPGIFEKGSSRALLAANLFLAATMALGSNWYFRAWNLLALMVLIPVHVTAGLGSRPWWDPWMLGERYKLLFQGCSEICGPASRRRSPKSGPGRSPSGPWRWSWGSAGRRPWCPFCCPC